MYENIIDGVAGNVLHILHNVKLLKIIKYADNNK